MKTDPKEREVEMQILHFLRSIGIFAWKNERIGTFDPIKKTFRKNHNPFKILGVSDILGVIPYYDSSTKTSLGRFLAIEVKTKTGKVSDHQRVFLAKINQEGGIAFVARSLDQCVDQLLQFFPHHDKLKQFSKDYIASKGIDH